jgi:hypothetical protein
VIGIIGSKEIAIRNTTKIGDVNRSIRKFYLSPIPSQIEIEGKALCMPMFKLKSITVAA